MNMLAILRLRAAQPRVHDFGDGLAIGGDIVTDGVVQGGIDLRDLRLGFAVV